MRQPRAGILGIIIALAAVTATVMTEYVLPNPPQPVRTDLDVRFGKLHLGWTAKSVDEAATNFEQRLVHKRVRLTGVTCAILAIPLAILSWSRRERPWWGVGIVAFAVAALAWQWFVIVLALLVLSGALFMFVPTERLPRES